MFYEDCCDRETDAAAAAGLFDLPWACPDCGLRTDSGLFAIGHAEACLARKRAGLLREAA